MSFMVMRGNSYEIATKYYILKKLIFRYEKSYKHTIMIFRLFRTLYHYKY